MEQAEQLEPLSPPSGVYLRLLAAVGALAAGAGAVIFVLSLLRGLPPVAVSATSSGTSATAAAASSAALPSAPVPARTTGFPSPPRGSVVFGARAGVNALGLAVLPQGQKLLLQASVVDQNGNGVKGLSVGFDVRATNGAKTTAHATVCGPGCYRANAAVTRPASVAVVLPHQRVAFAMPAQWPAPSAATLVENATLVYKGLHSLVIHDTFGDGHASLFTIYRILAPDKLTYAIKGG